MYVTVSAMELLLTNALSMTLDPSLEGYRSTCNALYTVMKQVKDAKAASTTVRTFKLNISSNHHLMEVCFLFKTLK